MSYKKDGYGLQVPIPKRVIDYLVAKKMHKSVKNYNLLLNNNNLQINGTVKKLFIPISFEVVLHPTVIDRRKIYLKVISMSPIKNEWINKKLFHRPPVISYQEEGIIVDLDKVNKIKMVPIGNIKHIIIKDNRIWCQFCL
ncbi:hypothetical protein GH741_07425 [Aquibacillus halophilus]|uniref:Uncharacterized protein n=1 Tax=Aquibacillus halophilus TaxID=930132 RepID=A0A6A8DAC6_9BACI|nr:hypothetical protein [Aquibacillus halophilus]MRH42514.1 hypothetical protein [Aquibacillus halophilus]